MQLRFAEEESAEPLKLHLGYVCRALNNHRLFLDECSEYGLRIEEIPPAQFLPSPIPEHVKSANELQLLVVAPDVASPRWNEPVIFEET
eukprot:6627997-Prorocentrum_lima.AAC.1